jgi:hypothetical protein
MPMVTKPILMDAPRAIRICKATRQQVWERFSD